ncbi:MAG: choice-of-anchor D domain-containing protein, partial [Betaproteobacteria bacterium]
TITLAGTATLPLAPAASISPTYIDFGEVEIGATSSMRDVVIANAGTAALHVSSLALTGLQAGEFHLQGSCMATAPPFAIAANGSCTIEIEFIAGGVDLRNAELVVAHDAPGSPTRIALTGVGVKLTCAPPSPDRQFQVLSCPAGGQGTLTQARDAVCQGKQWEYGPWTTIANTCTGVPPAGLELVEYYNSDLNHYFITADPAERQSIETGGAGPGWIRKGTLGRVWTAQPAVALSPVCRFYGNRARAADGNSLGPNSHFYTIDADECEAVRADPGWKFEGPVFDAAIPQQRICPAPLIPMYRNYNGRSAENDSNHRYATDPAIVLKMISLGWTPEGVVLCVAPL